MKNVLSFFFVSNLGEVISKKRFQKLIANFVELIWLCKKINFKKYNIQ